VKSSFWSLQVNHQIVIDLSSVGSAQLTGIAIGEEQW